eukprot:2547353-Rhodomonas_salina.1
MKAKTPTYENRLYWGALRFFEKRDAQEKSDSKSAKAQMNPDQIRGRIAEFLETKEMTQAEFCHECGLNGNSGFHSFMLSRKGCKNKVYLGALRFFEKRDAQEKSAKAGNAGKKRKEREERTEVEPKRRRRKPEAEDQLNSALVQLPADCAPLISLVPTFLFSCISSSSRLSPFFSLDPSLPFDM